jgi:hypothetical protein
MLDILPETPRPLILDVRQNGAGPGVLRLCRTTTESACLAPRTRRASCPVSADWWRLTTISVVGANALGLIVDWEPVVAACASAGNVQFGFRNPDDPDSVDLPVCPQRVRRLVDATFAGTTCAFYWDEEGELRVRARGRQVLQRDERGEVWAKPRKSGKPVDLKLDAIPGVEIRHMPGPGMRLLEAGWFYRHVRDDLPEAVRRSTDALVGLLYPESVGEPNDRDDLGVDASVTLMTSPVVYGLRPATVSEAVLREADVSWAALRAIADKTNEYDEYETFEITMTYQMRWLTEASERGQGVIALLFQ